MNLLFICASNSVRSQIAEGWARHLGGAAVGVRSAGLHPFKVHPMAVKTMKDVGVDIAHQTCRRLDDHLLQWADLAVILSENAEPFDSIFPKELRRDHWNIPNPDALVTDGFSQDQAYAKIRDTIKLRVERLLRTVGKP